MMSPIITFPVFSPRRFGRAPLRALGATWLCLLLLAPQAAVAANPSWPAEFVRIDVPSLVDGSVQPALFHDPLTSQPAPLLVSMHSWSTDYTYNENADGAPWILEHQWVFIQPQYRGPNRRPEACMSEEAVLDVLSAIDYARRRANVDDSRIYLFGGSGGGHAAMQIGSRAPRIFAGVSAWVGISDLEAWYVHCRDNNIRYAADILACLGGDPTQSSDAHAESILRSPLSWIHRARGVPFDINHGINDNTIPSAQSIRAFNILAAPADRFSEDDIAYIDANRKAPPSAGPPPVDPFYPRNPVLLRRSSGNARLTIFDGGHLMITIAALEWLSLQHKELPPPAVSSSASSSAYLLR